VTDLVGAHQRGRAFGWYNLAVGVAALPASLLFGMLWDRGGPALAFSVGAAFAAVASVLIALAAPRRSRDVAAVAPRPSSVASPSSLNNTSPPAGCTSAPAAAAGAPRA
jgi:MFS family permease